MEASTGRVVAVIGTVVDLRFPPDNLPPIYGAVYVSNPTINDKPDNLVLEVAQHIGDSAVRCIAMETTDGLRRGQDAIYRGTQIEVPVSEGDPRERCHLRASFRSPLKHRYSRRARDRLD